MEQRRVVRVILILIAVCVLVYLLHESWWFVRQHSYDRQIRLVAAQHGVSPFLVKAVVWRESKFNRACIGKAGEVGLMQVTAGAGKDWAAANKCPVPTKTDLLKPM